MFSYFQTVSKESHGSDEMKQFSEITQVKDDNEYHPKKKKIKQDAVPKKSGSQKYKTKFSTEWSATWSCIQTVESDICIAFCTVCSCKVNCSHQGIGDIQRHLVFKKA